MIFQTKLIEIGTIYVGRTHTVEFMYDPNLIKRISNIISSCDCSDVKNTGNSVVVKYKAKEVPKHLQLLQKTSYKILKEIKVYYVTHDGLEEFEILHFSGLVKGLSNN